VSGDDAPFLGRALWHGVSWIPSWGDVGAGGRSRVRGGILGCRLGAVRLSASHSGQRGRLGLLSRMGPLSRGDVGAGPPCVRVASIDGCPPARGGSGVPQWGGASTACQTAWSVAPGYAPGRRGDGSAVLHPEISGQPGLPGLPTWVAPGHSDVSEPGSVRRRMQWLGVPPSVVPRRCQPSEPLRRILRSSSGGESLDTRWLP